MDDAWQPIETAPRDGTEIIGMDAAGFIARTWYFAPSSRTFGWLRMSRRPPYPWWHPSDWRPMPPPPSAADVR